VAESGRRGDQGQTVAVLFISQERDRQRQSTPRQHGHQALLTQGRHQAREGHGRNVAHHRTPFQTEPAVGGQQSITGHVRPHRAIAQDEVWQDGEDRFARGALDAPEGEPAQANPGVMGVTRQAPAPTTGRLVPQLKAQGEEESDHQCDKGLAVVKQLNVGRLILKIDGDGPVLAYRLGCLAHLSPPVKMVVGAHETPWW
jgi:hypothetical protein